MIAASAFDVSARDTTVTAQRMPMPAMARTCAVQLIDRRTGAAHRINGTPLVIYTRRPDEAVAELLRGRDARIWEARVEALEPEPRR